MDLLNSSYAPTVFWIVALIIFLIVEASTVGLVSLWFAGGSLVAFVASLLHAPIWLQLVLFLTVSAVLLAVYRPLARRHIIPHRTATNADRIIGTEAYVTECIDNVRGTGAVRVGGVEWSARSNEPEAVIEKGALIRILRIEGAKVTVEPAQEAAQS